MATLQFKGKNIIWNHHMSVPYHTLDLDEKLSYKQDKADGNLIIEGDNLPALKSLLPQYTGKIDCIYIDPPYNTGIENWVYSDNINSPLIKDWFGKVVNADDLTRHDKWLCMMAPRLKLLRDFLSSEGFVAISIDDNEVHHLRTLMDEVFGSDNFLSQAVWRSRLGKGGTATNIANVHEYVLIYAKDIQSVKIRTDKKEHKEKLERLRQWGQGNTREDRPSMYYKVVLENGEEIYPVRYDGTDGRWRIGKEKMKELLKDKRVVAKKSKQGQVELYKIIPEGTITESAPDSFWENEVSATTAEGSKELMSLMSGTQVFDYPKPSKLIKHIINLHSNDDAIVLDAFAGSGTTAQAVLELNEEDEGNRKFILIQMPENSEKEPKKNIARDITRERVVKVIEKKLKNKDIGFEYRRVGQPIDAETILSGQLPTYKQLAKYVYYLATGQSPKDKDIDEKKFLAGKIDHTEVYLLYTPDMEELKKMAITFEWAKEISKGNDNKKIVYAPACFMDDEYLEQFNIKFVSIPYNLFEREQ